VSISFIVTLTHCDENPKPLKPFLGYVTNPSHWCRLCSEQQHTRSVS